MDTENIVNVTNTQWYCEPGEEQLAHPSWYVTEETNISADLSLGSQVPSALSGAKDTHPLLLQIDLQSNPYICVRHGEEALETF